MPAVVYEVLALSHCEILTALAPGVLVAGNADVVKALAPVVEAPWPVQVVGLIAVCAMVDEVAKKSNKNREYS